MYVEKCHYSWTLSYLTCRPGNQGLLGQNVSFKDIYLTSDYTYIITSCFICILKISKKTPRTHYSSNLMLYYSYLFNKKSFSL